MPNHSLAAVWIGQTPYVKMQDMEIRIWLEFSAGPQLVIFRKTGVFLP